MRLRRRPVRDEIVVDGELVVMVGDSVLLVGEIGARLLLLLPPEGADADVVRQRLVEEFGEPEDPDRAWERLVSQLTVWGLLDAT